MCGWFAAGMFFLLLAVPSTAQPSSGCLADALPLELQEAITWTHPLRRLQLPESLIAPAVPVADGKAFIVGGAALIGRTTHVTPTSAIRSLDEAGAAVATEDARLPRGRFAVAGVATPHGIVLAGGDLYGRLSAEVNLLDPTTMAVKSLPALPSPRSDMAAAWDGDRVLLAGGFQAGRELLLLDPETGKAERHRDVLPTPRRGVSGFMAGSEMVLVGGYDESTGFLAEILLVDPAAKSAKVALARLPTPRAGVAVLPDATGAYLVGGYGPTGALADVLRYDFATGLVTPVGLLPEPRSQPGLARVGQSVYVVGGGSSTSGDLTTAQHRDVLVLGTVAVDCARPLPGPANLVHIVDLKVPANVRDILNLGDEIRIEVDCGSAACSIEGLAEVLPPGLPASVAQSPGADPVYLVTDSAEAGPMDIRIEFDANLAQESGLSLYDGKHWVDVEALQEGAVIEGQAGSPDVKVLGHGTDAEGDRFIVLDRLALLALVPGAAGRDVVQSAPMPPLLALAAVVLLQARLRRDRHQA